MLLYTICCLECFNFCLKELRCDVFHIWSILFTLTEFRKVRSLVVCALKPGNNINKTLELQLHWETPQRNIMLVWWTGEVWTANKVGKLPTRKRDFTETKELVGLKTESYTLQGTAQNWGVGFTVSRVMKGDCQPTVTVFCPLSSTGHWCDADVGQSSLKEVLHDGREKGSPASSRGATRCTKSNQAVSFTGKVA